MQFRLLFPGENLSGLPAFSVPGAIGQTHLVRETVWALYARAMLLWHACVRIRGENVSDHERALFANAVWREADAIENALDGHTCQTERAFLFQGREYLFKYVNKLYRSSTLFFLLMYDFLVLACTFVLAVLRALLSESVQYGNHR